MMDCALKMMDCALNMMECILKTMDFAGELRRGGGRLHGGLRQR